VAILFGEKVKIISITQAQIAERLRQSYRSSNLPSTDGYVGRPTEHRNNPLKCAAVLVPLTFYDNEWHLLYTRRTDTLNDHSGQVSFPGGHCDAEDGEAEDTALREADEEIGLKAKDVQILGRINEIVTVTNYEITPVVGVFPWAYSFFVSTVEVGRVFTMPLNWLADPKNYWEFQHPKANHPTIAYHPYDGELLWGATARITVNFLNTILNKS
jgi:8-oxo-dGTP pyrophosphatase MutT (NUDIX family)